MAESSNSVKDTAEAMQGLLKEVPIYQDLAQPALQEAGRNLVVLGKAVKIALAPITALVWGYETIAEYIHKAVTEKLKNVPQENIIPPALEVAGPAIEALRFAGNNEDIRELYANLLANSMDSTTAKNAHPSFVEIIKNISSDEAHLMKCFVQNSMYPLIDVRGMLPDNKGHIVQYKNHSLFGLLAPNIKAPNLIPSYIDNLCRLGLIEIPALEHLTDDAVYKPLEESPEIQVHISTVKLLGREVDFNKKYVRATSFGLQFCGAVVAEKK